jgi:hypothetical protein
MRLVVRTLRKAGLTAGALSPVVPEDLEGSEDTDERDSAGPQGMGPPHGASAVQPVEAMDKGTRYRLPSGERRRGTAIAYGAQGATIVDHSSGERVRVDHGHYLHDDDDEGGWQEAVNSDLELGPRSKRALHAVAALAADAGVEAPHALRRRHVSVSGNTVTIGGKSIDHPHAAATMAWLLQREGPDADLWSWEEGGKKTTMTEASLQRYRSRIGALPPPTTPTTPTKAGPRPKGKAATPTALRKAAAVAAVSQLALQGPRGAEVYSWPVRGYTATVTHRGALTILTIMGKGLPLPFHLVIREPEAATKAEETVAAFEAGRTPNDGVFRALDLR